MKQSFSLVYGALLAAFPLAALLTGCGGGGGIIGEATPTPSSSPTATSATPVPTSVDLGSAPVVFSNNQIGTLSLTRKGTAVSGTVVVNDVATQGLAGRSTQALSFSIKAGTYQVSGTFTPPRGFSITGNFPAPVGAFSITGAIPTTSETGSYTLKAGGETVTGTYPKISTLPTPVPSATTPPVGLGGSFSGTIVGSSDANFGSAFNPNAFNGTTSTQGSITVLAVSATETTPVNKYNRAVGITLSSASGGFSKGQVLPVTALGTSTIPNAHVNPVLAPTQTGQEAAGWGYYQVKKGQVTISELTSTSVTLVLKDVQVVGDYGSAKGTLTLNGTFKANYKSL